jgi:hypothetical protein
MIRFDEFTFSLPRLWIVVGLLILVDLISLGAAGFGNPISFWPIQWLPRPVIGTLMLFGPFAATAIWLVLVIIGAIFHGRRALWLLLPALLILPAAGLNSIVLGCAFGGGCP